MQSSAASAAAARRSANRVGMRLASATESQSVTTKTITNHNHTRALTVQYWQVLRNYDVTTTIDGLTLVCLVPLKMLRFMPAGQPVALTGTAQVQTRAEVLARYANIIDHLDVLSIVVPRQFQYGLKLLGQFASDPTAQVSGAAGVAEDVIALTLQGNFLPCETVSVNAVTRRGTRVGPVQLVNAINGMTQIPANQFLTRDDLIAWLLQQRQGTSASLVGTVALPPSLNRTDIVGFEITRSWLTVSYTLAPLPPPPPVTVNIFGVPYVLPQPPPQPPKTVTLTPGDLETAVGAVTLTHFSAAIEEITSAGSALAPNPNETYANDPLNGVVLPLRPYPIPALQLAPVLRYQEILEIERAAQHIIRNTARYSQFVWASLSDEERAILLDGYTIGVPPGGVSDPSQLVPLLNCVQNRVVGFFGNSMVMPFSIPQSVAESMDLDPAQLQASLLAYQQAAFVPPQSLITLPTQGVLGEAVLGHCPSAEKIDLTRFWNWQDSPSDAAPGIAPITLPTSDSIAAGLTAPSALTNTSPLINNVLQAPTPSTALSQALVANAAQQQDFSTSLTGADQLSTLLQSTQSLANSARADALHTSQQLTAQAMATVGNLVGASMDKAAPDAGSKAAQSVLGTQPPADKSSSDKSGDTNTKASSDT